jgi:hypothetical protein
VDHRVDAVEVERLHVGGVVEDVGELQGEALELVGGEGQAGEAGDVGHLVGRYPGGHGS